MNHITYLKSKQWVCQWPEHLGSDFIVADYGEGMPCKECSMLVRAHNMRESKYDMLLNIPTYFTKNTDSNLVRGFLYALPFALGLWIGIWLILHFVLGIL